MRWREFVPSPCSTHHIDGTGRAAYADRFDEVLKFHPPGLAAVQRENEAWHIREDGSEAYRGRFLRTFGYYDGRAAVVAPDGWHHIDSTGRDVHPQRYAWCGNFQSGLCTVRNPESRYFHIRPDGCAAYAARWRYAGDFRDGIAVVQRDDGLSTHIGDDGQPLHGRWFLDLDVFHKGFARACDRDGWHHVDLGGRPVYAERFAAVEPFYNGQARVERFDGGLEVIDETGGQRIELRGALRSEFSALSADLVGFWKTRTIAAAAELGIFDFLPASDATLARECRLDQARVRRLLHALGELKLVRTSGDLWEATPRGAFLRNDHPMTLSGAALEYAGPFDRMWNQLADAVRNSPGSRAPDVFADVACDAGRLPRHTRMLNSYALHDYRPALDHIDLRGIELIVDAGGGVSALGRWITEEHPSIQVTVLERPEIVERFGVATERLRWLQRDLLAPWDVRADMVILARVLHDWDDEAAQQILVGARGVLPEGGRLVILEMLLDSESSNGRLCDLHLLMVTGGRERTRSEYEQLLHSAGFRLESVERVTAVPALITAVAI